MQTKGCKKGYLYVALIVIVLMGGHVMAIEGCDVITKDDAEYYEGGPITITGTTSGTSDLFFEICDVRTNDCEKGQTTPISGAWQYQITSVTDIGIKNLVVWNNASGNGKNSCAVWAISIQPASQKEKPDGTVRYAPTRTPTPDYSDEIEKLEQKIEEQEKKISVLSATPEPTKIEIVPVPTATVNHTATIAALEAQIAEQQAEINRQKGLLDMILSFLGLN
jgi:hypothetical protein